MQRYLGIVRSLGVVEQVLGHTDLNGLSVSNQTGQVTARWQYSPYGMVMHKEGTVDVSFLYGGAFGVVTDAETGLVHMRARYYHPHLCRFLSEEPIGFAGGMNWFGYANSDPLMRVDPNGHQSFDLVHLNQRAVQSAGVEQVLANQTAAYSVALAPAAATSVAVRAPKLYMAAVATLDETGVIASGLTAYAWKTATLHHVATIENTRGRAAGGPYTPMFEVLCDKFGVSMNSSANTILLPFHGGPHPQLNRAVYRILADAPDAQEFTNILASVKYQTGLPDSYLNSLATRLDAAPYFQGNNQALSSALHRVLQGESYAGGAQQQGPGK